ncbi:hypothetical protein ACIQXG_17715 [Lysinibacillus sphaericus]|uniref:hypothetical protein n=1 Tax=Lysinibacillus sphaericus TaxID=1421 RepID=UPI0038017410
MKKNQFKHTVKLRKKQPDILGYGLLLLRGAMPLIAYLLISFTLNTFPLFELKLPNKLLVFSIIVLIVNSLIIWHFSPWSLSKVQRIKNILRNVIETNKFYYENTELNKILKSMIFKFYWLDSNFYIEAYPNGASYANKMNELTMTLQTALNLTVISVQSDFADHTTYVLTDNQNNVIVSTNDWDV